MSQHNLDPEELRQELQFEKKKKRRRNVVRNTMWLLLVAAACAVLTAVLFLPVLRIYGTSMTPTLTEGDIVVSIKGSEIEQGDIIGVYYGKKLLIKRSIAKEHQWVDIDGDGNVYIDGSFLDEPYLKEGAKDFGPTNIDLPYQVPDNSIFVMGDHRETSVDSRNTSVGSIDKGDIVGKIVFRLWPLSRFGRIEQ